MFGNRRPKGFAPGAMLDCYEGRVLREAGFEPGYPLFSTPNHSEADDLQLIIHALTFSKHGDYGDPVTKRRPIVRVDALVPDDSGYGELRFTPMKVAEIRRSWQGSGSPYWYLTGSLVEHDPDQRWFINRKRVEWCRMHLLLKDYEAFVQLVPMSVDGTPLPLGTPADLQWGDLSSRNLPPKKDD